MVEVERVLKSKSNNIAAFIVEPVIGVNAFHFLPKCYLARLRKLTKRYNVLLIFDEVITGFFRIGPAFAFQYADVVPDILCAGKGLSCGYAPIGITLVSHKISNYLSEKPLDFGMTNNAHPISCAAALETLELMTRKEFQGLLIKTSNYLKKYLEDVAKSLPTLISNLRGRGMLYAMDLFHPRTKKALTPKEMLLVQNILKQNGLMAYINFTKSILPVAPPLNTGEEEMAFLKESIGTALRGFRVAKALENQI